MFIEYFNKALYAFYYGDGRSTVRFLNSYGHRFCDANRDLGQVIPIFYYEAYKRDPLPQTYTNTTDATDRSVALYFPDATKSIYKRFFYSLLLPRYLFVKEEIFYPG
jgi:hypothetical protein